MIQWSIINTGDISPQIGEYKLRGKRTVIEMGFNLKKGMLGDQRHVSLM